MNVNSNRWNRLRYTIYTPVYDLVAGIFSQSRKKSISQLNIQSGDRVLLVGAGTGLDLLYLPRNCKIFATDLTPSMVERIRKRCDQLGIDANVTVMDGQNLTFQDEQFDHVILHLILAVIPDPIACIREVERVLKPNGQVAVFDKFVSRGQEPSALRKVINSITTRLFSDITRSIEKIVRNTRLQLVNDEPADFGGNFRIVRLQK